MYKHKFLYNGADDLREKVAEAGVHLLTGGVQPCRLRVSLTMNH